MSDKIDIDNLFDILTGKAFDTLQFLIEDVLLIEGMLLLSFGLDISSHGTGGCREQVEVHCLFFAGDGYCGP